MKIKKGLPVNKYQIGDLVSSGTSHLLILGLAPPGNNSNITYNWQYKVLELDCYSNSVTVWDIDYVDKYFNRDA